MLLTLLALSLIATSLLWTSTYHALICILSVRNRKFPSGGARRGAALSVVIPAKNEPVEVLERSLKSFSNTGVKAEVILVLDDPIDRVGEIVRRLHPVINGAGVTVLARLGGAHGRNGAIADGMRFSTGENLMVVDADCIVNGEVLNEASTCCGVCVARWKPYLVYATPLEEAMAFLTDYGSWLLYKKRFEAGLFIFPLGSGTVISRNLAEKLGFWPIDALQDDIRLGTMLAEWGIEPTLLRSRIHVSVPATLAAARVQQSRWAFGACDVLRRFGLLILRSSMPLHKRLEALIYVATPLTSVLAAAGFAVGVAAGLSEANVPLLGPAVLVFLAAALGLLVEGVIMRRFAVEEGWDRCRANVLMGRVAALTTIMAPIVSLYALLGLAGVRIPYRITPKRLERRRVPDLTVILMLALSSATVVPSAIHLNLPVLLLGLLEMAAAVYGAVRFA